MGVSDYGTAGDRLDTPSLADWAAAVAAALDNDDTTVDARVSAKAPLASPALTGTPTAPTAAPGTDTTQIATTAFVQDTIVVSRPNTDDYLVQVVQGGVTKTVFYDSGVRALAISSDWTSGVVQLRRVGNLVHAYVALATATVTNTAGTVLVPSVPTGFRPTNLQSVAYGRANTTLSIFATDYSAPNVRIAITLAGNSTWGPGSSSFYNSMTWQTGDAIPTSLPGTLVSAAPA